MKFSYNGKAGNDMVQSGNSISSGTFYILDGMSTPARVQFPAWVF